jgi:transcriptional regulator GlxA family with amidase domain
MFDPAELNRIASTDGRDGGQVRLTGHRPVSAAAGTQLSATISYLREQLMPRADAAPSALVESTATAHFAAAVLNAFPNNAVTEPTALDRKDARPILLRRAIAFVDDNAHTEISLADIAAHVYVTPRTVQYLFRRHLDCTPMEYIRRVRMHHAHRDLVMADPVSTTVTRVANKWGFAHTGRFAVRYRQMFGQSPHETLRGA